RTINDYDADGNPIHSESEINSISNTTTSSPSTSNRKNGCLGIIVALIIFLKSATLHPGCGFAN
ncbi:MAG: hypothetical protein J6O49_16630, partial [Bacteroidaceae bacterium]|nr:hypothetical protein [Bacteroidaceae bacterium]